MTYEDIRKANEAIKTVNVSGKDYAEVNQRIKAFRMVYPQGFISTEMVSNENGVCIFKASVGYTELGPHMEAIPVVLGTGTAYEKENSTFINKTSYIENCETSAVGRALGMCGFGIDTSICSAEELQNAKLNQDKPNTKSTPTAPKKETKVETNQDTVAVADVIVAPPTKDQCVLGLEGLGADINKVLTAYKYKSIDEMPLEKLQEAYRRKKASQKKEAV